MSMKKIRFSERAERLGNVEWIVGLFLFYMLISAFFFWVTSEIVLNPRSCRQWPVRNGIDPCSRIWLFIMPAIACTFGFNASKLIINVPYYFWRPLQARPLGRMLRCFLRLKRMRLDQVVRGDSLELHFVTLTDSFKPYQAFTLTIKEMHRFVFYRGDHVDNYPGCIFQEGALLEFSYLADSKGLDYARARVRCEHEGQVYHGELELEADSYELRLLPTSVLENRQ